MLKSLVLIAFSLSALIARADVSSEIANAKKAVQSKTERKVLSLVQDQVKAAKLKVVEVKQTSGFSCQYGSYSNMDDCLNVEYQNGWSSNFDIKLSDGRVCNLTLWIQNRTNTTADLSDGIACFKKGAGADSSDLEFTELISYDELK